VSPTTARQASYTASESTI